MFSIVWNTLVTVFLPIWWRKTIHIAWLNLLVSQVKAMHTDFLNYRTDILYKINYNGQICYLQKALNDKFDPLNGIYIDNVADITPPYIYRHAELKQTLYIHKRWKSTITYVFGNFVLHDNIIWQSSGTNLNSMPSKTNPDWMKYRDVTYIKRRSEYATAYDFIVYVPSALVFDINQMKALINYYKIASKRYTILTY